MSNKDIYHYIIDFIDMNKEFIDRQEYIRVDWLIEELKEILGL